jgi:PPOX class probable F420-dependent enzyme
MGTSEQEGLLMPEDELWQLITAGQQAVLATTRADGSPQLSNVLYVVDAADRTVRISTKADTAKVRHLRRDPRAALHVSGRDFWAWAVAEGTVTLSDVAAAPGDPAAEELRHIHTVFYGPQHDDEFYPAVITQQRIVVRVHVQRVYGLIVTGGRRPISNPGA